MAYPGGSGPNNQWSAVPQMPGGYGFPGPGGYPMPPQRKGSGAVVIAVVVVLLLVIGGGVAAYMFWPQGDGQQAQQKTIPDAALDGLLLTPAEAGAVFGVGPLAPQKDQDTGILDNFADPGTPRIDEDCIIGYPDNRALHDGSGWTAVRLQFLQAPPGANGDTNFMLDQSVVSYPDADAAKRYVETVKTKWQQCANRAVNQRDKDKPSDPDDIWDQGAVTEQDNTVSWPSTERDDSDWTCIDSMTPRDNIVIGLENCHFGKESKYTGPLVAQISAKIDKAAG